MRPLAHRAGHNRTRNSRQAATGGSPFTPFGDGRFPVIFADEHVRPLRRNDTGWSGPRCPQRHRVLVGDMRTQDTASGEPCDARGRMRLSMARSYGRLGTASPMPGPELFSTVWRRVTLLITAVLILACVGTLLSPAKKAGASTTVFASGQVFASVGFSNVNVYDPSSGNLLNTLTDDTNEQLHDRQRLRRQRQFLRDRRLQRRRQRVLTRRDTARPFSPPGLRTHSPSSSTTRATCTWDSRPRPTSPSSPPTGQRLPDIGPLANRAPR